MSETRRTTLEEARRVGNATHSRTMLPRTRMWNSVPVTVGVILTAAALTLALSPGLAAGSSTGAGPLKYSSTMGIQAEIPKPKGVSPNAGGTFALALSHTGSGYTVTWKLTFYRLSGKALAAHIHVGPPSGTGPVVVPLCGPCTSGQSGKAPAPAALVAALKSQTAYVNVHTKRNPQGEIRGRIYPAS